eukprot:CAMPEP_0167759124 /NCGR_PEP_ID=MMETSP0110_2-20121227/10846_1 /TAXON_ID=629695 /ORGANISM="Gymnochlora sp., Strain CCMP2014" /LENGTH=475 /DNA_ID=CAMNT_0007645469 /DNA_START=139 /DNA_END=1566 /DNA_ORIENTATION=-
MNVARAGSSVQMEKGEPEAPFMEFQIAYDPYSHQATEYKLDCSKASCSRPHMRAFHLAWTSFLMAFIAWFSFAPLGPAIKKTLKLKKSDLLVANIASVLSTVFARFAVGPIMDIVGPRKGQAFILVFAAIPTFFAGLIQNVAGLATVRALVGVVGAAFVGCQFWCSLMFTKEIAGTMNAIAGGWGNLGGGLTQIFMVGIFNMNLASDSCDRECAWRNAFYIPAFSLLVAAALVMAYGDDCPKGEYVRPTHDQAEKAKAGAHAVAQNPQVWVLVVQYAVCFGIELHVNNTAALYYFNRFGVSLTVAGIVASLFGLMNLFARAWGGMISDYAYAKYGMNGRKYSHIIITCAEGIMLIIFSRMNQFGAAIAMMIFFSVTVQCAEGSTFGIVPYVDPKNTGGVCGFVGAGGNIGAVLWGVLFLFTPSFADGYMYLGVIVFVVGLTGVLINVKDTTLAAKSLDSTMEGNSVEMKEKKQLV